MGTLFGLGVIGSTPGGDLQNLVGGPLFLAIGLLAFRLERRFYPPDRRVRRIPTRALFAASAILLGASLYFAAQPMHGNLTGDVCGSALDPRSFEANGVVDFAEFDCEYDIQDRQIFTLTGALTGLLALGCALRRPSSTRPTTRPLLVVAMSLAITGVGAVPALAAERETDFAESLRPSKAAVPLVDAICDAQTTWANTMLGSIGKRPRSKKPTAEERKTFMVLLLSDTERATKTMSETLRALAQQYGDVPGGATFVGLIEPFYGDRVPRMTEIRKQAEGVSTASDADYKRESAMVIEAFKGLGEIDLPSVPDDYDAASVALTMKTRPKCFGFG